MEMFLLAWLADQVLTGGLQQLVKAIKQSDADKIVERTVRHVRDGLAGEAGSDRSLVDRLTAWLDDLLRARRSVVRRGSSTPMGQDEASEALIAHLRQAAEQSELELPSGERAPVGNVMAALGMDLDGLADRVMTASRTALNEVAALAGGASEVRAQRDAETARRTLESVDGTLRETGQGVQRTEQIVGGIQQDVRALVDRGDRSAPTAGTDPVDRLALSAAGSMPLPAPALRRRPELLRKLRRLGGRKTRDVGAVIGPPGVGKTQLVAAYARERAAKGWPVVWITAESQEQVITGYADLADVLGLRPAGEDSRTAADRAFRWLCGRSEPCLLVLDNATDPQVVRPWLPPGVGATRCVVTSTRQVFGSLGVKVDVAVFAPDEARAFLRDRLDVADPDGEKRLVTELGRHPLGLALAAAVVERRGWSYDTYLEAFGGRPVAEALRADLEGDPYPRGIQQAIGLSMDAAAPAGSEPRRLLELVAVLAPAGAAISLLATGDSEVHDAVGDLVDASLVSRSEDRASVVVHRLTARVVREFAADAGALDTAIATATELVRGRLWPIAGSWNARHEADPLVDHTESLLALVGPIEHEDPAVGAPRSVGHVDLAARVVRHLIEVHDPTRAIPLGRIVLDACTTMSGECRDTMISRGDLARAHELVGRSGEAIALHEMNLATCVRAFGEDHLDASILRNNLAEAYESVGRLDEAIALYELDLATNERLLVDGHPYILRSRNGLARAYGSAGRSDEAIALLEQNLASCEWVLSDEPLDILHEQNRLADAYESVGRLGEAIDLYERNLTDCERMQGDDHPDTLRARHNLAGVYEAVGRSDEATELYEPTLAGCERVLGDDHPNTLLCRSNLAGVYESVGRLGEAIALYERTLADYERVLGEDHPETQIVRNDLARAYESVRQSSDGPAE